MPCQTSINSQQIRQRIWQQHVKIHNILQELFLNINIMYRAKNNYIIGALNVFFWLQ